MASSEPIKRIAQAYFAAKDSVFQLEGKAAKSALTARVVQDLRHVIDHLMIGLSLHDAADTTERDNHYEQVMAHLESYIIDSYEVIAGRLLKEAKSEIERARLQGKTGQAANLHRQAIQHYTRARELRTQYPEEAIKAFDKSVELSLEAGLKVEHPSTKEKVAFWVLLLGGIWTLLNILKFFGLL